jgi:hypothetical protein
MSDASSAVQEDDEFMRAARSLEESARRRPYRRPRYFRRNAPLITFVFVIALLLQLAHWIGINWNHIIHAVWR